ncbi:MAG: hypothetical protein AMJ62_15600 [Myxococcales bacterium SG8_38]|nr:MAG: hypothetical protein AMJ62_15600 [Myxococcales bacterium SG8_38]
MRQILRKLLLVAVVASVLAAGIGSSPSSVRAYHTYRERLLDDSAYSLERREARLGLMQMSYGILDELQVTTYTYPWILGAIFQRVAPNVELKSTFYDRRKLALSASVGFVTGTITQSDSAKLRYFIVPTAITASVRPTSLISFHLGGKFTATDFSGIVQAEGNDVGGAVVVNLLQVFGMLEWRLSRVTAFTFLVRWAPYVSNSVLRGDITIGDDTEGTIEAEVDTDDLKNAWALVPGFTFSWARTNLKLGVGYGDLFLPGIGLLVPGAFPRRGTPTPVLEFDIFVRF